jgi:hypothetical protein
MASPVPLFSVHHHLVHEGGWTLRLQPDRTVTVLRPDGSTAFEGRTTNQRPAAPTPQPTTVDDVREAVADGAAIGPLSSASSAESGV